MRRRIWRITDPDQLHNSMAGRHQLEQPAETTSEATRWLSDAESWLNAASAENEVPFAPLEQRTEKVGSMRRRIWSMGPRISEPDQLHNSMAGRHHFEQPAETTSEATRWLSGAEAWLNAASAENEVPLIRLT